MNSNYNDERQGAVEGRASGLPMRVLLVLSCAVLLNYIDRGNLATAAPLISSEFSLSNSQIGMLLSCFFWTYAPSQLLAGWLSHRFDARRVLAAGVALWSAATAMTGFVTGFTSLFLVRLLLGLGESASFPASQLILARQGGAHQLGRANGFLGAGQGVGPLIGTLFGGLAMAHLGWRAVFVALGIATFLWLWPWYRVASVMQYRPQTAAEASSVPYGEILGRREFWGAALGHFGANYTFYFIVTWMPSFIVKAGGYTIAQMSYLGAAIYGAYALSTLLSGAASDRWIAHGSTPTRVRKTFALSSVIGASAIIFCCSFVSPHDAVWLLIVAGVFFGFGTPMIFTIGTSLAGPRAAGRWAGAQNLAGQCAGIIGPAVTGFLVDRTGTYSTAFIVTAAAGFLAVLGWGVLVRDISELQWRGDEIAVRTRQVSSAPGEVC